MLIRIAYAAAAALLAALTPVFIKAGARKTAPAVGAWLFSFVALSFAAANMVLTGATLPLAALDTQKALLLALAGLTNGCMWLCLFRALAGGLVNRVMPVAHLSSLLLLGATILFLGARIWLWRACFIVLVLIGTVLMESRDQRARSAAWLLYAAFAALFSALSDLLQQLGAPEMAFSAAMAIRAAVSFGFLTVVAAAGRSFPTIRQMDAGSWCFTLLAGAAAGGAWLCRTYSTLLGDWSELLPITCAVLPLTALFARICLKERMPGVATLGLILILLGNFALLMNV